MAKPKVLYSCLECGTSHSKWSGQCSDCGAWNTLEESIAEQVVNKSPRFKGYSGEQAKVQILSQIKTEDEPRFQSGMTEIDRVLGGGIVPGSVILIGGDPGVGKSTLLLQILSQISLQRPVLYVTGEESPRQVSLRGNGLKLPSFLVACLC